MGRATAPVALTKAQRDVVERKRAAYADAGQVRWADRCRAVQLVDEGYELATVARLVKRPYKTTQRWLRDFRNEGLASLEHMPRPGRPRKLDAHERLLLGKAIERGPRKAGYPGSVWTSPLVADYILKRWNVSLHPGHVRRLLNQMGYSIQFPRRKLALADQAAQEKWLREDLPGIKKKPSKKASSSSSKTK